MVVTLALRPGSCVANVTHRTLASTLAYFLPREPSEKNVGAIVECALRVLRYAPHSTPVSQIRLNLGDTGLSPLGWPRLLSLCSEERLGLKIYTPCNKFSIETISPGDYSDTDSSED